MSLHNLGAKLAELDRYEEARSAFVEATDILRSLSANRPDAFSLKLIDSLSSLSPALRFVNRRDEALAPMQEAIVALTPFFSRTPEPYSAQMATLYKDYLIQCSELNKEPDPSLLEPLLLGMESVLEKRKLGTAHQYP